MDSFRNVHQPVCPWRKFINCTAACHPWKGLQCQLSGIQWDPVSKFQLLWFRYGLSMSPNDMYAWNWPSVWQCWGGDMFQRWDIVGSNDVMWSTPMGGINAVPMEQVSSPKSGLLQSEAATGAWCFCMQPLSFLLLYHIIMPSTMMFSPEACRARAVFVNFQNWEL